MVSSDLIFVRKHTFPEAFGAPDAASQCFKLYNLAVIRKEVHFRAVVSDVPGKCLGIGRFKHQHLKACFINEGGRPSC